MPLKRLTTKAFKTPKGFLGGLPAPECDKAPRQTPPNHPNTPKHPLNDSSPPNITNKQENVKTKNLATP
jgi:hypothetical protein